MRGEWAYYESLISEKDCDTIIELASRRMRKAGTVGGGRSVDTTIRRGEVVFVQRKDPEFAGLFQTIDYCVDEANDEWFGVRYNRQGARFLQFGIYHGDREGGGGFYNPHVDVFLVNGDKPTQRKLSVMVQLSDPGDYEGGDFQMHHVGHQPPAQAIRKRGTVLVFPSLVMHAVTEVTQGTRYSLVGWYLGPPWC